MSIRRSDLLLLAVAVVWGSSYLAAQTLVVAGGVLAVLALRFLVSAIALAPAMAVRRPSRPELRVGALLGLTQSAVLALETYGVSLTSATNAGVLISLTILLTPALEGAVRRQWLRLRIRRRRFRRGAADRGRERRRQRPREPGSRDRRGAEGGFAGGTHGLAR